MINKTRRWEVRIEWRRGPSVTWPPYTFAQKPTRQEAEAEAARAITYGGPGADLSAVAVSIRAPGDTQWREVARNQGAEVVSEGAESVDVAVANRRSPV